MRVYLYALLVTLLNVPFSGNVLGQSKAGAVWLALPDSRQKADSLATLAHRLTSSDLVAARPLADSALAVSTRLKYPQGLIRARRALGTYYEHQSQYPKALVHYRHNLFESRRHQFEEGIIFSLLDVGVIYYNQSHLTQARTLLEEGLKRAQHPAYTRYRPIFLNVLGTLHGQMNFSQTAFKYYRESLAEYEAMGKASGQALVLNNIGDLLGNHLLYVQAISYYKKALAIAQAIDNRYFLIAIHANLGDAYRHLGQYEKAHLSCLHALEAARRSQATEFNVHIYSTLGEIATDQKQYAKAIYYFTEALKIQQPSENSEQFAYLGLGRVYLRLKQSEAAENWLHKARQLSQESMDENNNPAASYAFLSELYENLALVAALHKKPDSALLFSQRSRAFTDSLRHHTHGQAMNELLVRYDSDQKAEKIEELEEDTRQKAIQLEHQSHHQAILGLGFALITIVSGLVLFFNRKLKTSNEKLQEVNRQLRDTNDQLAQSNHQLAAANEQIQAFSSAIVHDFRTTTKSILLFNQLAFRATATQLPEHLDHIRQAVCKMDRQMKDLLLYSRLDNYLTEPVPVDLNRVLEGVRDTLQCELDEAAAQLKVTPLPVLLAHETLLERLLCNLMTNAIKYRRPDVPLRISLGWTVEQRQFILWIRDNGVGIPENQHERIFELFARAHTSDIDGSGVGLAICKRIARLYGGFIRVESKPGEGATFFVTLPAPMVVPNFSFAAQSIPSTAPTRQLQN
ncbi:ATP-binding protein [Tellurirhabdus rosea]|uniref:ATP-binding protein n=1 Tax=Tellurirhabdus rosea TaxID=2674997 RepID=UPI0022592D63|nr:ATP-binding protein [Tellurirhabdus rosea]